MVKIGSFAGDSLLQVLASLERRLGDSLGLSSDLLSILDGLASTNGLRLLQGSFLGPELFSLLSSTRSLLGLCLPWFPGLLHDLSSLSVPLSISSLLGGFLGSLISCGVSLPEGQPLLQNKRTIVKRVLKINSHCRLGLDTHRPDSLRTDFPSLGEKSSK